MKLSLALVGLITFSLPISFAQADEHSALKPVPRTGGWMTRHESFNKRVSQGKVDLVFIGDSITEQRQGTSMGRDVTDYEGIKEVFDKTFSKAKGGDFNGIAMGISGDTVRACTCDLVWWRNMFRESSHVFLRRWRK